MGKIYIEGIKLYAYHGCLAEEGKIGANYLVDVSLETDFSKAESCDNLEDTVDYVLVFEIVRQEMAIRSNLLEHVARRIIRQLQLKVKRLKKVEVRVSKLNPPMNGNVEKVSVVVTE
jgi:dihydroneopterin aldolase